MAAVTQPEEPTGLPTGNPWDLAYPLGHLPPVLKKEGGPGPEDPKGYIGEQVSDVATEASAEAEAATDESEADASDDTEEN